MSVAELRRQARSKSVDARKVYRARSHGLQLWLLLWSVQGLSLAAMVLAIDAIAPIWVALPLDVFLLVLVHVLLPWSRFPKTSLKTAARVAGPVSALLNSLSPAIRHIEGFMAKWVETEATVRIHSKQELLEVLQRMEGDFDKIGRDELGIAEHALTFGEKQIYQVMTPRSQIKSVSADEKVTPVVIDELHQSGFSRFPVYKDNKDRVVAVVHLRDLTADKASGKIIDHAITPVHYVGQDYSLDQVLNAFLRTKQHLFIVVNEFEEITGLITIEDVIEQIIGRRIVDEFDRYDDLRAVAAKAAADNRKSSLEVVHHVEDETHQD